MIPIPPGTTETKRQMFSRVSAPLTASQGITGPENPKFHGLEVPLSKHCHSITNWISRSYEHVGLTNIPTFGHIMAYHQPADCSCSH